MVPSPWLPLQFRPCLPRNPPPSLPNCLMSESSARQPCPTTTTTPTRTPTTSQGSLRTVTTSWSSTATPKSLRTARWRTRKKSWWRRSWYKRIQKKSARPRMLVHWHELFHQHELWKILVIIYRYATIISNTTLYCSNAHVWYIRDCLVKQEKETNIPRQRMKKQDWTNDM